MKWNDGVKLLLFQITLYRKYDYIFTSHGTQDSNSFSLSRRIRKRYRFHRILGAPLLDYADVLESEIPSWPKFSKREPRCHLADPPIITMATTPSQTLTEDIYLRSLQLQHTILDLFNIHAIHTLCRKCNCDKHQTFGWEFLLSHLNLILNHFQSIVPNLREAYIARP